MSLFFVVFFIGACIVVINGEFPEFYFCLEGYNGPSIYLYGTIEFEFFGTDSNTFKYQSIVIPPEYGDRIYAWRNTSTFYWYFGLSLYDDIFAECTTNSTQLDGCLLWNIYGDNETRLNITVGSCYLNGLEPELYPNYLCTYGHMEEQFDTIINEWKSIGYGRIKGINNQDIPYYVDTKDSTYDGIISTQFVYLILKNDEKNYYIWGISSVMDYNISTTHAYCNVTSIYNNSLTLCNEWYININGVFKTDQEFVFLPNNCPTIGADLCLYDSNYIEINGDYQSSVPSKYHTTFFFPGLMNYYVRYDPINLTWIVSRNVLLNDIILYCNITNIDPFNPLLCNNNWYNGSNNVPDTLKMFNSKCDIIPTKAPTNNPTYLPSKAPTNQTIQPTFVTLLPTMNPTMKPSFTPTKESVSPTIPPSMMQNIVAGTAPGLFNSVNLPFVLIMIGLIIIITCCVLFGCLYSLNKYYEEKEKKDSEQSSAEELAVDIVYKNVNVKSLPMINEEEHKQIELPKTKPKPKSIEDGVETTYTYHGYDNNEEEKHETAGMQGAASPGFVEDKMFPNDDSSDQKEGEPDGNESVYINENILKNNNNNGNNNNNNNGIIGQNLNFQVLISVAKPFKDNHANYQAPLSGRTDKSGKTFVSYIHEQKQIEVSELTDIRDSTFGSTLTSTQGSDSDGEPDNSNDNNNESNNDNNDDNSDINDNDINYNDINNKSNDTDK